MFQTISNFMRVRDIRNKIIFTLLMLIIFRIGTFIPVPNVDATVLKATDQFNLVGFLKYFWRWCVAKLLYLRDGNYAIHHSLKSSFSYCKWT
ncbi:Protein translocase subunit SecY [Lysinibacillus sphaericus]